MFYRQGVSAISDRQMQKQQPETFYDYKVLRNGSSLRDVAADTDAADGPHGLGMQCHCTGVMPTGRACSDRPGFAKFARVTEMLVVPDENCGVVPRMSGA